MRTRLRRAAVLTLGAAVFGLGAAVATARTSAPPNWKDVFTSPPAGPCSSSAIPFVAAMLSGPDTSANPSPPRITVGRMPSAYRESRTIGRYSPYPTALSASPVKMSG